MDDRDLAEACRRGDRTAWDELVSRYTRFVTFAARRQLRNPTEELVADVVQNVFVELLKDERKAWGRYDPAYKLTTWLGLVVLTQVERATRGRKLQPLDDRINELAGEVGSTPDEEAIAGVRRALSALTERERLMIILYYQDGLGTKEIAATTGVPANTVASHLMRAREKLRKVLTPK